MHPVDLFTIPLGVGGETKCRRPYGPDVEHPGSRLGPVVSPKLAPPGLTRGKLAGR